MTTKDTIKSDYISHCVEAYNDASSMREAAKNLGISVMKLRKILITAGAYSTVLSKEITALYSEGEPIESICEFECMSRASVYSYLPYQNVVYNLPEKSREAKKQKRYRERNAERARTFATNTSVPNSSVLNDVHKRSSDNDGTGGAGAGSIQTSNTQGQRVNVHSGQSVVENIVDDELLSWLNAHPGIVADLKKRSKTVRGKFVNIHVTNIEEAKALCDKYNVVWKIVKNRVKEQMKAEELGAEPEVDFKAKTAYSGVYDFLKEVEQELDRAGAGALHDHVDILLNEDGELLYVCSPYYTGGSIGSMGYIELDGFTIEDSGHYPYMCEQAIVIRRR